jgi:hypothetical protein
MIFYLSLLGVKKDTGSGSLVAIQGSLCNSQKNRLQKVGRNVPKILSALLQADSLAVERLTFQLKGGMRC